jgi:phenylacetate-CoA ligase
MLPFIARSIFHLQERLLGRHSFEILKELNESQWWPRERLDALRLERLQSLAQSAWTHSPYWRSLMETRGFTPADIRDLSDLQRFPLMDKETIRNHCEEIVWREEGARLQRVRTSGSTNEPLTFYTNSNREAHINAARMRGHEWVGMRRGQKEMYFWGSPIELSKQDCINRFRDWLINDALTNGFAVKPDLIPQYFNYWMRWRPKCLFGYPCSLSVVATMAPAAGIHLQQLKNRGLQMIITTSEMLTDSARQTIADAFGVPVYDSYGLREGGLIGHECKHFAMHTTDEQLILETIDPQTLQPTDGEGELVLTNIVNRVTPVIRYRTGDIVTLSKAPCPCGRTLDSVRVSGGRVTDFIITADGTWVPGYAIQYVCRAVPGIAKFQIHQDEQGKIRMLLAVDANFPADGIQQVQKNAKKRLASDDEFDVQIVDDIPAAPSGKQLLVIGKLAQQLRNNSTLQAPNTP